MTARTPGGFFGAPRLSRLRPPDTARDAVRLIICSTVVITLLGGTLMRIFDPRDFPTLADGDWWALQTVTTVGYGDIVPHTALGRSIASGVLLYSLALMSILTAVITTSFIERTRRQRQADQPGIADVLDRLDALSARLDSLADLRTGDGARNQAAPDDRSGNTSR